MSIEKKIAEIISKLKGKCFNCQGMPEHYCKGVCDINDAKEILFLFKIEVDCTECGGTGFEFNDAIGFSIVGENKQSKKCPACKGAGKVIKPIEPGLVGRII